MVEKQFSTIFFAPFGRDGKATPDEAVYLFTEGGVMERQPLKGLLVRSFVWRGRY